MSLWGSEKNNGLSDVKEIVKIACVNIRPRLFLQNVRQVRAKTLLINFY